MSEEITITDKDGKELSGPLSTKHLLVIRALGTLFIWMGRMIRSIDTYEKMVTVCNQVEEKMEKFEKDHEGGMDDISVNKTDISKLN